MLRLAELLGGLSLAADLANGFPQGKVLRTALLAVELGSRAGLATETLRDAFYTVLLRFLGCTGFAHEEAHEYGAGDDIAVRNTMAMADAGDPIGTLTAIVRGVAAHAALPARVRAVGKLLADGEAVARHSRSQCDTSLKLAQIVGMSAEVCDALRFVCERWDGRGAPSGACAQELAPAARLLHVADVAEIAHHRGGRPAALHVITSRSGGALEPALAGAFVRDADALIGMLEAPALWERFLAAEPAPHAVADDARFDDVARAVGYFADLKSVYTLGHAGSVASLAQGAARELRMPEVEARLLVRAGHLHDVGRLSVPNSIWDHAGPLGFAEWERVRQHAYFSERVLGHAPALRELAQLASAAHERLDGGGYHRGLALGSISRPARVLAAADAAAAMLEPRPHRAALARDALADELRGEVRARKLDRECVEAVLAVLGMQAARGNAASGLSDRELEVLRLLARGKTNREIGTLLGISARTVQNHVAHVYDKLGVYSRAGAALHAIEHGLLT